MSSIAELRERLQAPRRPYDTFYGLHAMRPLSIYCTAALAGVPGIRPAHVTLFSVALGLLGALAWSGGHWAAGALLINAWYLFDHVDGELARLTGRVSATGLFFDTIANAIVAPLAYAGLGAGVAALSGEPVWAGAGIVAAYGSLMMLVIPYCETVVRVQSGKTPPPAGSAPSAAGRPSLFKRAFMAMHAATAFPVFLPVSLAAAAASALAGWQASLAIWQTVAAAYALMLTAAWISILVQRVFSGKLDL